MVIAGLIIAAAVALVGGILAVVATARRPEAAVARATAPRPAPAPSGPLRVSDLGAPRIGSHMLDVAPPAQGYGAVDPVAQIPWALAIAQGWAEDARLERVDVERLRPDGTANVADDPQGSLGYRFLSPAHRRPALVPRLQRDARYTAPYLSGYLVHLETEGWVWYLTPLGSESVPRIRATDARPWPYRRRQ